ncbi:MAG: hypothetical protein ACKPB8_01520 [Alphaproteobacteria bacterium]
MLFYLARCAAQFAVALVGIVTVAFFLMRAIPGDPALYMLGDFATAEALATLARALAWTCRFGSNMAYFCCAQRRAIWAFLS